jgi:hypothetical protein
VGLDRETKLLLGARTVTSLRFARRSRLASRRVATTLGALVEEHPVFLRELGLQALDLLLQRDAVFALRGEKRRRQLHHALDQAAILRFEQARGLSQSLRVLLSLQIDHARRVMNDETRAH